MVDKERVEYSIYGWQGKSGIRIFSLVNEMKTGEGIDMVSVSKL